MREKRKSEKNECEDVELEPLRVETLVCMYVRVRGVGWRPVLGGAVMTLSALVMSAVIHGVKIVDAAAAVADKQQDEFLGLPAQ